LSAFTGILRGLQLECELDESDSARQQILEHIRAPLEASEKAAKTIVARLNQILTVGGISVAFGKVMNKETAAALHVLDQAKLVLDLALDTDQRWAYLPLFLPSVCPPEGLMLSFTIFSHPRLLGLYSKQLSNTSELWQKISMTCTNRGSSTIKILRMSFRVFVSTTRKLRGQR